MSGGKTRKPANMIKDSDKLSKKQIMELKDSVVKIGNKEFNPSEKVKNNDIAMKKWFEIMEMYEKADIDIVTSADIGILERYCITHYEYIQLLCAKEEIDKKAQTHLIAIQMCNKIKIDDKINTKNKILTSMEGELFLTPLSKSRAIPKEKGKTTEQSALEKAGFGGL